MLSGKFQSYFSFPFASVEKGKERDNRQKNSFVSMDGKENKEKDVVSVCVVGYEVCITFAHMTIVVATQVNGLERAVDTRGYCE